MRNFCAVFFILFAAVISANAQRGPIFGPEPLPELKQFLQLTDVQLTMILVNNNDYNRWSAEKQMRIGQVQGEISDELDKENLDPGAIGIRYAEIEAICRDLRARAADYRTKNVQLLTDPQRAKLKVLEDAMKLQPEIGQAQSGNLIGNPNFAPVIFTSINAGIGIGSAIGGILGGPAACNPPAGLQIVRTGDFSSVLP